MQQPAHPGHISGCKTNIRMRDVDKLKIERIWFNFYFGGKDTAPGTCHAYLDDVVIAEGPIGPQR